jgi:ATP/maltotriose-dependent transcriptional regulator MalT
VVSSEAYVLFGQAQVALEEDRLQDAQSLAEQALSIRRETSEEGLTAISQLLIADIALEQGNAAKAGSLATEGHDVLRRLEDPSGASEASGILAGFIRTSKTERSTGGGGTRAFVAKASH